MRVTARVSGMVRDVWAAFKTDLTAAAAAARVWALALARSPVKVNTGDTARATNTTSPDRFKFASQLCVR